MLQCVAVWCSVLQRVAVWCSVLQRVAACCSVVQRVAVCCSVLQCGAVCCSVLQCGAVWCSVLQRVAVCLLTRHFSTCRVGKTWVRDVGSWFLTDMHLDNHEIKKNGTNSNVLCGQSTACKPYGRRNLVLSQT